MTTTAAAKRMSNKEVTISGLNHISVPVRDRAEALRFWSSIFRAEFILEAAVENFTLIRMPGGFDLGLSEQPGGWTGRAAEYPHYAFDVDGEVFEALKQRLEAFGVPTNPIWTRFRSEALMYFRDPSGNLFELYCHEGYKRADSAPVGSFYGGTYKVDFEALNYETWNDPGK